VGAGSTFRILLPAVFDPLEADAKRNDAPRIVRGSEPLLVVEDEEGVRTLLKTALSQAGYRVSDHPAPAVALEALRREPASAVLVVSDVIMPGMSGPEMVRKMREFRPDLKVLYISGYPEDELGGDATLDEAADFLTKPFSTQQLATKVRALLDRVRPPAPPKRQERP
jgi:two-component system cell cycle sensor histidine kinase/response regulator CckA